MGKFLMIITGISRLKSGGISRSKKVSAVLD
jgi:hypothetical protein